MHIKAINFVCIFFLSVAHQIAPQEFALQPMCKKELRTVSGNKISYNNYVAVLQLMALSINAL